MDSNIIIYKSTFNWNAQLPYTKDEDYKSWLNVIRAGLAHSAAAGDYAPGVVMWAKQLSSYMNLKLPLTENERVELGYLMYTLLVNPKMSALSVNSFSGITIQLIGKEKYVASSRMQLPWRPLYNVLKRVLLVKQKERVLPGVAKHLFAVGKLVEECRRFFSPDSISEIIDEFLPKLSPPTSGVITQTLLCLFLPTNVIPKPSFENAPPLYYLPTVFSFWQAFPCTAFDCSFFDLLSRVAQDQVGSPENARFTEEQVKFMFTIALKNMDLPVGSGSTGHRLQALPNKINGKSNNLIGNLSHNELESFAKFVIYTIYPISQPNHTTPPQINTLCHLAQLLQAIETYLHPSNYGRWVLPLAKFLLALSTEFLKRLREETNSKCKTPVHYRLNEDVKRSFVLAIRPSVFLAMFSKDPVSVITVNVVLKYLVWIAPEYIFPGLLDRVYPSLETLTESHRTVSCIGALSATATALFNRKHYPAGGRHVAQLLNLVLPGIDVNDPQKTISSSFFIVHTLMAVPLVDVTKLNSNGNINGYGQDVNSGIPSTTSNMEIDLEEEDDACRLATLEFEDWAANFLQRVFVMMENLPQQHGKTSNDNAESSLLIMVLYAAEMIFTQASPEIHNSALRRLVQFASTTVIPNATKAIGMLCGTSQGSDPNKALAAFVPLCCNRIMSELAAGAGSTPTSAAASMNHPFGMTTLSDSTLHWYQSILMGVIYCSGEGILNYKDELVTLIKEMLNVGKGMRSYKWSSKILRNLLMTLLRVYSLENRSISRHKWENPAFMADIHKKWGALNDEISIDLHNPSPKEVSFAFELIEIFWLSALKNVKSLIDRGQPAQDRIYSSSEYKDDSNEFSRWITLSTNLLIGTSDMIGPEAPRSSNDATDPDLPNVTQYPVVAGYALSLSDPRYAEFKALREQTGGMLHLLAQHFLKHRPDDIDPIKPLVKAIRIYLTNRGIDRWEFEDGRKSYRFMKACTKTIKDSKQQRPRYTLIIRAVQHHLQRQRHNASQQDYDDIVQSLFKDLRSWSVGKYTEVRKAAQSALSESVRCFTIAKLDSFYAIMDSIVAGGGLDAKGERDSDKIKGALYLLQNQALFGVALSRIKGLKRFAEVLTSAHTEDKPSVQELIRKVFMQFFNTYPDISLDIPVEESTRTASRAVLSSFNEDEVNKLRVIVANRESANRQMYRELLDNLIGHAANPQLHWRFSTMTINFIEMFIRKDEPIPPSLSQLLAAHINSELPAIRHTCLSLMTYCFVILKERSKLGDGNGHALKDVKSIVKADDIDTGRWLEETVNPTSKVPLQDDTKLGWYCFSSSSKVYSFAVKDLDTPAYTDNTSLPAMDILRQVLSNSEFWAKFVSYASQESTEGFRSHHARFYQSIIGLYQDAFMDILKPIITSLVLENGGEKSKGRAGLEMLGGIVRGSKHFGPGKLAKLWGWVVPLVKNGINAATLDTLPFWEAFLRFSCRNRDPRRVMPVILTILQTPLDPNSSSFFSETKKLYLVLILLISFHWRILPLILPLLPTYINAMADPYKQVRDLLGSCMNGILQMIWHPSAPNVMTALRWNLEADGCDSTGQVSIHIDPKIAPLITKLFEDLNSARAEAKVLHATTNVTIPTVYSNRCKTILSWTCEALSGGRPSALYPYLTLLLPAIFGMHDSEDSDLVNQASTVISIYPHLSHIPSLLPPVADILTSALADAKIEQDTGSLSRSSWHIRLKVLPVIQVLFFKNLFGMSIHVRRQFVEAVLDALFDPQIEIRHLAAVTLSGLIRCSQRDDISVLKERFANELAKRLTARVKGSGFPPGYTEALLRRHAAVLGLSSLVTAFPYEVPGWLPEVLVLLAKCHSDPAPISQTVSKTFADFKRTHQDTWHEDSRKFTGEQLEMLTDLLISQSYYA